MSFAELEHATTISSVRLTKFSPLTVDVKWEMSTREGQLPKECHFNVLANDKEMVSNCRETHTSLNLKQGTQYSLMVKTCYPNGSHLPSNVYHYTTPTEMESKYMYIIHISEGSMQILWFLYPHHSETQGWMLRSGAEFNHSDSFWSPIVSESPCWTYQPPGELSSETYTCWRRKKYREIQESHHPAWRCGNRHTSHIQSQISRKCSWRTIQGEGGDGLQFRRYTDKWNRIYLCTAITYVYLMSKRHRLLSNVQ